MRVALALALAAAVAQAGAAPARAGQDRSVDRLRPAPRETRIIPLPKSLRWLDGAFEVTPAGRILVGAAAQPEDLYAARDLNRELAAWGAPPLEVVRAVAGSVPAGTIVIGEPSLNPLAADLLARDGLRVAPGDPGPEGYVLLVTPGYVVASGADRRGTYYAVQTLRQLLGRADGRLVFQGAAIRDWPDHRIRAVHVLLDDASDVFHTAMIERIFSRYKFNMLIAQADYVRWDSARNLWHPGGATKAQAAAVVAAARAHLMDPVPLIPTLGHVGWLFANDQNLDLLEMPAEAAPARFVYHPLNPRVYQVILPILDEAVALFRPRYLHIGHDEVRNVVPFPWSEEGRRLGFGELFVRDVLRLYEHLASRGVGTMMWADVLLSSEYVPEWARLPRDILMVDWQYQAAARYPSLDRLRALGFPVLGATWHGFANNAALARDALRAGAAGLVRTTWTGFFGNRAALQSQYQQLYSYLVAADHFWHAGRADPSMDEIAAAARFRADWHQVRENPQPASGRPLDLRAVANRSHTDDGSGWLGKGPAYDLRGLPMGLQRFGGVPFLILDPLERDGRSIVMLRGSRPPASDLPDRVRIGAGFAAAGLCFLHALPYPASQFGQVVATYRVRFADDGVAAIPVRYRQNIGTWLEDPASIDHEIVWTGRTRSGVPVRLSMLCWTNPDPQRPILTIDLEAAGAESAPAIFAITALERPRGPAHP
ncbi:MAG: beta-N-acetylhexosaminidase [Armatimonadota bacterium]|nr:beta-N-acetylhexosaminidase [Armatimonadota bacterium]